MFQLFILTIFLIASPTFGLIENLFASENECYSGCNSHYVGIALQLNACRSGCFFKLHHENCADQCKLYSIHEQIQASCVVGCAMYQSENKKAISIENLRPKSIILIRLHQRPLHRSPFTHDEPMKTLNDIIKQMKEQSTVKLGKKIPLIKVSNEENSKELKDFIVQQEDKHHHLQQLIKQIRSKWHHFTPKESKLPGWILFSVFIIISIILWFMIVSLCRAKPKHYHRSISAEELIFEKDILQLDTPVKIKLTNI